MSISTLLNSGFDSFTNLYDVFIQVPSYLESTIDQTSLSVRAKDFSYTAPKVESNPVHYKTIEIETPTAKFTGTRELNITFRGDSEYNILNTFFEWKHLYVDPSGEGHIKTGTLKDTADFMYGGVYLGKIKVYAYQSKPGDDSFDIPASEDEAGDPNSPSSSVFWFFDGVKIIDIATPSYSRDSSNPVEIQVRFSYLRMKEPKGTAPNTMRTSVL